MAHVIIYALLVIAIALLVTVVRNQSTIKSQLVDIRINIGILQRRGLLVVTTLEEIGNDKLSTSLDPRFNDRRPNAGVL